MFALALLLLLAAAAVSGEDVPDTFIVSLEERHLPERGERVLARLLGDVGVPRASWTRIERPSFQVVPEMATDFEVVHFRAADGQSALEHWQARLAAHGAVRSVSPEQSFRSLKRAEPEEDEPDEDDLPVYGSGGGARHLAGASSGAVRSGAAKFMGADALWRAGFTGQAIRVAVFDTGLGEAHPDFRRVRERTNWTDEDELGDVLGHGTFVAGVIAGTNGACPGFAPDADLFTFRVFNSQQKSFTSWFLDAFNYAIHVRVHVLNLSIGGPDFGDRPFVDKVLELSANNVLVVSAIGNDGGYGTLNNPADMMDVLGVGGMDAHENVAPFSSRGMTLWELPYGYGRVKPDVVAIATRVAAAGAHGGCRTISGSSVASPVAAGLLVLLASIVPPADRWDVLNPATLKQVMIKGAVRLETHGGSGGANIFEQGAGRVDLDMARRALELELERGQRRTTAFPEAIDMLDCPYMWPYCDEPLYHSSSPTIVNVTLLNGMGVVGRIEGAPVWKPTMNGDRLRVHIEHPAQLWPWVGYLAIHLHVPSSARMLPKAIVEGKISFMVVSPARRDHGESEPRRSVVHIPVRVAVHPTPPRERRVLFDIFHNLNYPAGYFPRDDLSQTDLLDGTGDHVHTNFRTLYTRLRSMGLVVETLTCDFTCFDARDYGTLIIADPEDEFFPAETAKLYDDVVDHGLNVVVLADWYHTGVMEAIKFLDDNTQRVWSPITGGANLPAVNDLLEMFGVAFGDRVFDGVFSLGSHQGEVRSGAALASFPPVGDVFYMDLIDATPEHLGRHRGMPEFVPMIGVLDVNDLTDLMNSTGDALESEMTAGRLAVFGDASCADDKTIDRSRKDNVGSAFDCLWLVEALVDYALTGTTSPFQDPQLLARQPHKMEYAESLPLRTERATAALMEHSRVLGHHAGGNGRRVVELSGHDEDASDGAFLLVQRTGDIGGDGPAGFRLDPDATEYERTPADAASARASAQSTVLKGMRLLIIPFSVPVVVLAVVAFRMFTRGARRRTPLTPASRYGGLGSQPRRPEVGMV